MKQSTGGGSINRRFSFLLSSSFLGLFFFWGGGETKSARRNGEFAYRAYCETRCLEEGGILEK